MRQILLAGSCLAILMACDATTTEPENGIDDVAATEEAVTETAAAPRFGTFGFDTTGMDTSVAPGDDFFAFANGVWAQETEIPVRPRALRRVRHALAGSRAAGARHHSWMRPSARRRARFNEGR